jgi:hypothetical protein
LKSEARCGGIGSFIDVLTRHVCVVLLFFCPPPPLGKGEAEEDISPSLSLFCLFVYPPASAQSFVLFNGRLFSHLYRYTYVRMYYYFVQWVILSLFLSLSVCVPSSTVFVRMKATRGTDSFVLLGKPKVFLFSFSLLSGALSLLRLSSPYRMTLSLIPVCVSVCARIRIHIYRTFF